MSRLRSLLGVAALTLVAAGAPQPSPTPAAAKSGADPSPAELQAWLRAVDDARTAFGEAKITARATQTRDGKAEGSADFEVYMKGRDHALVIFRGGKNDGRKALTVGQKMWLIVPGAENPVPVSPNQRLMGGASFGDVARMRFAEDFTAALRPGTETVAGQVCRVVDLTASAPRTPYPRITLWLDAGGEHLPRKLLFLLSSGKEAREVEFTGFKKIGGRTVVTEMQIHDLIGPNANVMTRLEYRDIQPAKIDDAVFTPEGAKAM